MKKIYKYIPVLLALTIGLLTFSCKTKKVDTASGEVSYKTQEKLVEDILETQLQYKTISTKGQLELYTQANKKKTVSANFKIVKDSSIQVSVRPIMGIEAVRITITPDSLFFINRLNKQYTVESFDQLLKEAKIDFNFNNLQALLTNQLFVSGKENITKKDAKRFDFTSSTDVHVLKVEDKNKMNYTFTINPQDKISSVNIFNLPLEMSLMWQYEDFEEYNKLVYPTHMLATAKYKDINIKIGIKYSKLDIDSGINVDTSIPKSYGKIRLEQLLELLQGNI